MSKLSELAWKRNGAIGRLVRAIGGLDFRDKSLFTEGENKIIEEASYHLEQITIYRKHNWEQLKKEFIEKDGK